MSYPTALPTRTTGLDPEGIGATKSNLTPLNEAERAERIPEDEYNRVLDAVVAICAILGEDGSVDPAALRVQVATLRGTQVVTSTPDTVGADVSAVVVTFSATTTLNVPPATAGKRILVVKAHSAAYRVDLVPDGTDTINGANAVWSAFDADQNAYRAAIWLIATADGAWDTDGGDLGPAAYEFAQLLDSRVSALESPGVQVISGAGYTSYDGSPTVIVTYAGGVPEIGLRETPFPPFRLIKRATSGGYKIRLTPYSGSDAINGTTAGVSYDIPGSEVNASTTTVRPEFTVVAQALNVVDVAGTDTTALDTRIDGLEAIATTPLSSTTGTTLSWEAQERVRLANTGTTHCLVTLNGDTTEWPVGRARPLSQYGSTTGGFTLAVPSGHKLNTVTNGTSGVIGTAAADDGTALYTVMVTREAIDEWSYAITAGDIAANAITNTLLRDSAGVSVIGRSANTTGDPADITAAADDRVLARTGGALGWVQLTIGMFIDGLITRAKLANGAALSVIGRSANSTGAVADIVASNDGEVFRRSGTTLGFGTIVAAGIASSAVTMAKIAAWPSASIYRSTAQAIVHNTITLLQCSSATYSATGGSDAPTVDLVTNYRITITRAGLYRVSGRLAMTSSNGVGVIVVYLCVNGTSRSLTSTAAPSGSRLTVVHLSELVPLVATDYVDLRIYQDSGVSQNTGTSVDQCPQLQVEYVGPTA